MLTIFNSFQIVLSFALWPFLIGWLYTAEFPASGAAFWAACVAYFIGFCIMVGSVSYSIDKNF